MKTTSDTRRYYCNSRVNLTSNLRTGEALLLTKKVRSCVQIINGEIIVSGKFTAKEALRVLKAVDKALPYGVRLSDQCYESYPDGFGLVYYCGTWKTYPLRDIILAKKAASYVFDTAARETTSGNWIVDYDEIETIYGKSVIKVIPLIKLFLILREGVSDVETDDVNKSIDINLYTDYAENFI